MKRSGKGGGNQPECNQNINQCSLHYQLICKRHKMNCLTIVVFKECDSFSKTYHDCFSFCFVKWFSEGCAFQIFALLFHGQGVLSGGKTLLKQSFPEVMMVKIFRMLVTGSSRTSAIFQPIKSGAAEPKQHAVCWSLTRIAGVFFITSLTSWSPTRRSAECHPLCIRSVQNNPQEYFSF